MADILEEILGADFDYVLPPELIAQTPVEPRDASRLMVCDRRGGGIYHRRFYDLPEYLREGDCLVLNDTKVIPARLIGRRPGTGGVVEVLLLKRINLDTWEALVRPSAKLKSGAAVEFGEGRMSARIMDKLDHGGRVVEFSYDKASETFENALDALDSLLSGEVA